MPANRAWQRHGCYKLGSDQFYGFPLHKALTGCYNDWNSLDHFDPTTETRRMFKQFNSLRATYSPLTDGLDLVQRGNWTHFESLPGSNDTLTELGLWTASRAAIPGAQTLTGNFSDQQMWLLFTNENVTKTYTFDCNSEEWISTPYPQGTVIQNLFSPFESYTLQASGESYFNNGTAPFVGCLNSISMDPLSFKLFVPQAAWTAVPPMLTKFSPGHDARLLVVDGDDNSTNVDVRLEFNVPMDCNGVTSAVSFNVSSPSMGGAQTPSISNVQCGALPNPDPATITGSGTSAWSWNATLTGVPDGIIEVILSNAPAANNGGNTGSVDHLLLRKGKADNVMVFPDADYDSGAFAPSGSEYTFTHNAIGADQFRYSINFGQSWTTWQTYETTTTISNSSFFSDSVNNWWEGQHITVQCTFVLFSPVRLEA